jgi:hypothetical protein
VRRFAGAPPVAARLSTGKQCMTIQLVGFAMIAYGAGRQKPMA